MKNKIVFGKKGESFASEYLKKKRYEILETNFRIVGGEIDIVAKENREIVFVEVKSREFDGDFDILSSISKSKRLALIRSCQMWLLKNNSQNVSWRIDFIGIIFRHGNVVRIEHLEGGIY